MPGMTKIDTSKTSWDLSPLLSGDDDPAIKDYRSAITAATDSFENKWRSDKRFTRDPAVLAEALKELEAWETLKGNGNEAFYFGLRSAQDTVDPKVKARDNQSTDFAKSIHNRLQFFNLRVGSIDANKQPAFLSAPELQPYKHWLERVFANAKYRLSEAEERIMMLKSTPAHSQWVQMTDTFISKEEREALHDDGKQAPANLEQLLNLASSDKKDVRDSAGAALSELFASYADVAEAELNAIMTNKKIDDELRGYARPDQARHIADDVDSSVVDALAEAVAAHGGVSERFYDLKAKLVGQSKLRYPERGVGYGSVNKQYTYDDSVQLVHEVFHELDPEFAEILKYMVEGGQLDVYPTKGKTGGAFCAGMSPTLPTYVMLNHANKLRNVTTLAHEMGHAINDELIAKHQTALNYGTPTSTAEVASTFMEDFVLERLMREADDDMKLVLRVEQLNDTFASIHRQIACYRFERQLHEAFRETGYMAKDRIDELFTGAMKSYLGKHADGAENWWVYWSHIRMFFYVYSYAGGLLISKSLQSKVRRDKAFIGKVKRFLSTGLSQSPKEIFADMDIDITDKGFWHEGLAEIERQLEETEALARKLGKL